MESWDFGFLRARTGNELMRVVGKCEVSASLYPHLVFEGEVSCLFSDTNIGKSIFAVQIGCTIAKQGHKVAYYDFELSERQFYMRYSENGVPHVFPDSFIRLDIDPSDMGEHGDMVKCIEQTAMVLCADTIIIDNLSWLCMDSEDGATANALMKEIKALQIRHGWTILVVAHTPKRNEVLPITINDLAGSRQLANFFDSIFALGRCQHDTRIRYLKQLKVRSEEMYYTSERVISFVIERREHRLCFISRQTVPEADMLRTREDVEADKICDYAIEMFQNGSEIKDIAEETGLSQQKVRKLVYNKKSR